MFLWLCMSVHYSVCAFNVYAYISLCIYNHDCLCTHMRERVSVCVCVCVSVLRMCACLLFIPLHVCKRRTKTPHSTIRHIQRSMPIFCTHLFDSSNFALATRTCALILITYNLTLNRFRLCVCCCCCLRSYLFVWHKCRLILSLTHICGVCFARSFLLLFF